MNISLVIAGLLGLPLGSFLNVVVHRLPRMTVAGMVERGESWLFLCLPLSHCPHCRAPIAPWHNIPLLSFFWLRGRAKCCGAAIGSCYPLIELGGGLIAIAAVARFGIGVDAVLAVAMMSVLLTASVIDLRKYCLPDILTLPLLWLGLLANIDARFALLPDAVLGAAAGYLGMRMLAAAGEAVFGKTAMGGGDFKLAAALGAWLGWQMLPLLIFLASVIGLIYALIRFLVRRGRRLAFQRANNVQQARGGLRDFVGGRFCFGPALSAAGAIMLFWGEQLLASYWLYVASAGQ